MKRNKISRSLILASVAMFAMGSVQGAVTAGSLVLFFQKPGNDNTVYVNLGNAATLYRGAAVGPSAANQALDIININSTLVGAFGTGWASDNLVFAGLAGVFSSETNNLVVNGDQYRTHYVSRARSSSAAYGESGSVAYTLASAGSLSTGATNMAALISVFSNSLGSADQGIVPVATSNIDNLNPTSLTGTQTTAFGQYTTGVQQRGSASVFGTLGPVDQVEFALDLQRLVPDGTASSGEIFPTGQPSGRVGTYEGTVVIDSNGSVSFVTVPEPSGTLALGILGTIAGLGYRRRKA